MRYYPTPDGSFPSVTSILEATQSVKAKARLQNWNKKQEASRKPGEKTSGELARERGTAVHQAREDHLIRGYTEYVSEEVDNLFYKIEPLLSLWDKERHIWCEKPVLGYEEIFPELKFFDTDLGFERGRLWSAEGQYAGCPDDIGYYKDVLTLCDVKTSKRLYQRNAPSYKPHKSIYARAKEEGEAGERAKAQLEDYNNKLYGYLTYQKTCIQLAAYDHLVKERMGLEVEKWMVMVAPTDPGREKGQVFILTPSEMADAKIQWENKLKQFKEEYSSQQLSA